MNLSFKNVLCVCCLLLSGSVYAQVPQDLIDKAKAAGMSDTQIQQELAKRMKQEGGSVGSQATATDAKVSDRVMPVIDEGQSLENVEIIFLLQPWRIPYSGMKSSQTRTYLLPQI